MKLTDAERPGEEGADVCASSSNASRSPDGWKGGRTGPRRTRHSELCMVESRRRKCVSLDDSLISAKWFSLRKTRGRGTAGSSVVGCVKHKTEQKSDAGAHRSGPGTGKPAAAGGRLSAGVGATTGSRPAMVSDILAAFRAGAGNPENSVNLLKIHLCIFIRICYVSIKMSMTKSPRDGGETGTFSP